MLFLACYHAIVPLLQHFSLHGCCVPVALGVLLFLHLQPGPYLLPYLHHRVLHAVTLEHEQPHVGAS